jgi:hypothetical protein
MKSSHFVLDAALDDEEDEDDEVSMSENLFLLCHKK